MKYCLTVFLLLLAVFSKDGLAKHRHRKHHSKSNGGKIVGGDDVSIQEYPHQAFLLLKQGEDDYIGCGGAIIGNSYILSAAHCFKDIISGKARIGSTDKYKGGKQYKGTFEVHPDYDANTFDNDIAIFKTDEEMNLDGINSQAVGMVDKGFVIPPDTMVKISGWGATSEGGRDSQKLRAVELPTWTNEECNKYEDVTDRQFCAGFKEGGKDSCQGDSGGPIVLSDDGLLVGLVSSGYGCARPNSPGVHTSVSALRDWVQEKTGI